MTPENAKPAQPLLKTIRSGQLQIGNWQITCHVLEDETRVITQSDFCEVLDLDFDTLPKVNQFLDHPAVKSPTHKKLIAALNAPILFARQTGGFARGYEGGIVIDYCHAIMKARQVKAIEGSSWHQLATAAENIVLAVSKVGIIALIDEATGYQDIRPKRALQQILDKYLRKDFAKWAKRFPDEFYVEMFRLNGWDWQGMDVNRPGVVGTWTNDVVYSRLAPGILDELRKRNPTDDRGNRKHKHHTLLTDEVGHPELKQHLHTILALMRVSDSWSSFMVKVDKAFPKIGETYLLELPEE